MKRVFILIMLFLTAMAWTNVDARWIVGERKSASQIKVGDTVVIQFAGSQASSDRYLQAALDDDESFGVVVKPGLGLRSAAIIAIEEGPADIRTEAPTVLLKLVETDKYVGNRYYDWYDFGQGATSSPDNAGQFQILSCGQEIPWYDETRTDDYTKWTRASDAIWDDQSVAFAASPNANDFCYLSYWDYASSTPRAVTWKYTSSAQWNVYDVSYERDVREDLDKLIDSYSTASSEFIGGTTPGFYNESVIEAYNSVLEEAILLSYDPASTDEQMLAIYSKLQKAYKDMSNSLIPVTEGYYYIINDNEKIAKNGKPEKAMFINPLTKQVNWGVFDETDPKFAFYITKFDSEQWTVQNVLTEYYFGSPGGFCKPFAVSEDTSYPSIFKVYPGTGSFVIKTDNWTMCPQGNADGTKDGPNTVWSYNGETTAGGNIPHHEWTWALRKVSDQGIIDRINEQKAQSDRTNLLKDLTQQANDTYDKLFSYWADTDNGLITNADKQVKFSTVRRQGVPTADQLSFLIDQKDSTYMQGVGYIDIAIDANPQNKVAFYYARRAPSFKYPNAGEWGESERPDNVTILATNDTLNGGQWTEIATINMGEIAEPIMKAVDLGDTYKFLRYQVNTNKSGGSIFTLSELQVYPAVIDETTSQYYTADGMKSAADNLKAVIISQKDAIANNTVTTEDIAALQAALDGVKTLFSDTTQLSVLISECFELAATTTAGDAIGQIDDESLIKDLLAAALQAETDGFTPAITKQEFDAIFNNLVAKRDNFLAHVKSFEAGKWYYIVNADATEGSTVTNAALYMTGMAESNKAGVGLLEEDGSAAYTYNPYAMWTFKASENGGYAIQNLGTGFYLGDFVKKNETLLQSFKGKDYKVKFLGAGTYSIISQAVNNITKLGIAVNEGEAQFDVAKAESASSWKIVEVNTSEVEVISIKDFGMNVMDVITLPYNLDNVGEYNEDVHIYGIKKITQDQEGTSTIEFYEKTSAKAGEPCWIVLGDPSADAEDFELLVPFPTSVTDTPLNANGLCGMLTSVSIEAGDVYSSGKELIAAENKVTISAHTGAILPSLYTGEVVGEETSLTLTIKGMGAIPAGPTADVNGDGDVNSADVVAIYNYISNGDGAIEESAPADVNGDGQVNSADVVAVYNTILGADAKSRAYAKQFARLLSR